MNSVEISHLNFAFKNQPIFKDLSLQIPYGSITGIVGPNGVGKSVLFKIIAGLIIPDSGSVLVNNANVSLQKFPNSFGALIEEPGFVERLSGYDNLKMLAGIQGKIAAADINRVLKLVGLWPARDKKVKNYSLGMKKKLGIAQAIMEKPQVIILDEPMNALDEDSVIQMRELFKKLAHEHVSIIIASHNMEDINILCDKVYQIKNQTLANK